MTPKNISHRLLLLKYHILKFKSRFTARYKLLWPLWIVSSFITTLLWGDLLKKKNKREKKTKNKKPILHAGVGGIAAAFVILGFTSTNCIY